jgi:glycosyltransferase involved in cell wall biosynthesis
MGFRLPSEKVVFLGQGIDVNRFEPPADTDPGYEATAISVGRIAPVKRIDEMIEAVALLRDSHSIDLRLRLIGGPSTDADRDHAERLREMTSELGIGDLVDFDGAVPFAEVPAAYHRGAFFLNLSETGSIDKAILESMASGCVPISRNTSFETIAREHDFGWLVPGAGPAGVADCIAAAAGRLNSTRPETVARLRDIVVAEHSLDHLADAVIENLIELTETRRRRTN